MPVTVYKGRGAVSRLPGRFQSRSVEADPDESGEVAAPDTEYRPMQARSIISSNQSPDVPFDRSINPYQGCEHGCIYCYARPSHSYMDLSPGLDFETKIFYKPNAVDRLLAEWQKPGYVVKPVTIGANTDPYQPAEKHYGITRALLESFLAHRHPVSLISKGTLMRRDFDLLSVLAEHKLCSVAISVPTMDSELKRLLEPRVPAAEARFRLIDELHQAGVPVSLLMAPIIPAVNDREIELIVANAAARGISHASYIFLRLPHEVSVLFQQWLATHMPDRAEHVMSLVRQASGGKAYDARFGTRQSGRGPYADMVAQRFSAACRRFGVDNSRRTQVLDCTQFRPPGPLQQSLDLGGKPAAERT
ncbi:MAG: PA0069 family radical SAM protein [Woeseiaceae bacterium]|nr:PA0069 family radical SAM protein [Woeseiaceae bacterium]